MTSTDLVILGSALAIGSLIMIFFRPRLRSARRLASPQDMQEVFVRLAGDFSPSTIVLLRGMPTKLRVQRESEESSSDEIVFPRWGIDRKIPAYKTTTIDFLPEDCGVFPFHSRDDRIKGFIVVVEDPSAGAT